ncbi:MAG: response regulator [Pirellulales bacterium]
MNDRFETKPLVYVLSAVPDEMHPLQQSLREADGLEASCCISARQFVQNYRTDRPGCLVMDTELNDVSGLLVYDELVAYGIQIPVIFLSGNPTVDQCVAAMRAGAVDFFQKSAPAAKLLVAIRKAVECDVQDREKRSQRDAVLQRIESLTARERETLDLVLDGLSTKQIASRFGIGFQTAAKHRARLLNKMSVRNDAQLVRLCMSNQVAAQAVTS